MMLQTETRSGIPLSRPTLSLCMIVKNEIETLEKCLVLARPHVDEIVIVDTGSTDGTRELAQQYADVYDEIEWPGSFSVARNYSLEKANCDYILILDGDEYIEKQEDWLRIREGLGQLDIAALVLPVRNLLGDTNVVEADVFWQERILRNHPDIRYHGSVHNQIMESIVAHANQTGRHIVRLEAEITHTGYALSEEKMVEKYKTRIDLLRYEYENPKSEIYRAYYGYQLGLIYYVMRRNEEAAALFNSLDYTMLNPDNAFYTHLLGVQASMRLHDYSMALVHANEMLTLKRNEPVAYYLSGIALLRAKNVQDGMLMLLQAFKINDAKKTPIRFVINPRVLINHVRMACRGIGLTGQASFFEQLLDQENLDINAARERISQLQDGFAMIKPSPEITA